MAESRPTKNNHPPQGRDPKLLLNPRANATKVGSVNGVRSSNEQPVEPTERPRGNPDDGHALAADAEPKRLMESFYGVEQRTAKPKRIKVSHDQDQDPPSAMSNSHQHHATGIVGDYLKPTVIEGPTDISSIVDLTNGTSLCRFLDMGADNHMKNRKTMKSRSQDPESSIKRSVLGKSHLRFLLGWYRSQRKTAVTSRFRVNGL